MSAEPLAGWHPWQTWAAVAATRPRFLIPDLIHAGASVWTGRPEAGKTNLLAECAAAVATGQPVLDRQPDGQGLVMVATSDPMEAHRWGERMAGYGVAKDAVQIARSGHLFLPALVKGALAQSPKLLVVDNVNGHLGTREEDSVRNDVSARRLHAELEPLIDQGCAVVLIAHSNKPWPGAKGQTKGPQGSTAYEAWARHVVHVDRVGNGTLKLSTKSNDAAPCEMAVDVTYDESGLARHRLFGFEADADRRPRGVETAARRDDLCVRIVGDQELARMSLRKLEQTLGISASTVRRALIEGGAEKLKDRWVIH